MGRGLAEELTLLQLEDPLETTDERVLHRREDRYIGWRRLKAEQQGVLMVLNSRDNPLTCHAARIAIVIFSVVEFLPPTLYGIDVEPAHHLLLAPAHSQLHPHDAVSR